MPAFFRTIEQRQDASLQRSWRRAQPYLYLSPVMILLIVLLFVPIFMVIGFSFFDNVLVNKNPVWIGLGNFQKILTDRVFLLSMKNTLVFVVLNVVFHLIIGMVFALMVNSRSLGAAPKAIFRVIYLLPWMFNATVIAILWKLLLNPNGIVNYVLGSFGLISDKISWLSDRKIVLGVLTFINIWAGYPFYMISILAGLQGVPGELYEASSIDGASASQTFFFITIPQLKPILISITMLDFIWTTQNFSLIWLLTAGGPSHATEMMSTFVYTKAFTEFQYSQASAAAVIILLACVILAIFYVRNQQRAD
jgi:multiple sugar transport system permease protein